MIEFRQVQSSPAQSSRSTLDRRMMPISALGRSLCAVVVALFGHASVGAQSAASPASVEPAVATQSSDAVRLVELWLDAQREYEQIPALSAAVVIGQKIVWQKGYGTVDASGGLPAAPDTIYSICSISKLFTSVAVMQLWERGKFSLDDDIGKLLPNAGIVRADTDSGPISVRLLLSHAAGLPREADAGYWTAPDFTFPDRASLYDGLRKQSTIERAGAHFQYSNLGMVLLGDMVAAASGQRYEDYVQQHVLAPLQMVDTRPRLPVELAGQRLATGFGARQRNGQRQAVPPFDTKALVSAAGYTSTVDDLARFAMWQFRLLHGGPRELLKASTLREMQRVQWSDPDGKNTWGLGFQVTRDGAQTVVSHAGWCPGFRSAISLMPQQQLAVVSMAATSDPTGGVPYARGIRQLMIKGLQLPMAPTGSGKPRLEDYGGRYDSQPWGSETLIVPWGDQLAVLDLPSSDPANDLELLRPSGPDRFRRHRADGSPGSELIFERDHTGTVIGVVEWSQRSRRLSSLAP